METNYIFLLWSNFCLHSLVFWIRAHVVLTMKISSGNSWNSHSTTYIFKKSDLSILKQKFSIFLLKQRFHKILKVFEFSQIFKSVFEISRAIKKFHFRTRAAPFEIFIPELLKFSPASGLIKWTYTQVLLNSFKKKLFAVQRNSHIAPTYN